MKLRFWRKSPKTEMFLLQPGRRMIRHSGGISIICKACGHGVTLDAPEWIPSSEAMMLTTTWEHGCPAVGCRVGESGAA